MSADEIAQRLDNIETLLTSLVKQGRTKENYSTAEVAEILHRAEFTVREWARLGRINAEKRLTGRGNSKEWSITQTELVRIQNDGLLPLANPFLGSTKHKP